MIKIILSFVLVFVFAGCGEKSGEVSVSTPEEDYVTVAFSGKPEFQPHLAETRSMGFCLGAVYEPLWQITVSGECIPILGRKIDNRGREVDIYIKEGVKWHDGSEFTSEDVVYTVSLITGNLSIYPKAVIEGAQVKDKTCATIYLSAAVWEPERLFNFPIVKNGSPLHMKEPNGTGIYRFATKCGFDTYLFEPVDQDKEQPLLRMINVRNSTRENELFRSGITDVQFVENSELRRYIPLEDSLVVKYPIKHMIYIGINRKVVPSHLRRAVNYAIEQNELTEKIYPGTAYATVVPYLSENSFSYNQISSVFLSKSEAQAGGYVLENGKLCMNGEAVVFRLGVMPGDGHGELAEEISESLKKIGIECIVQNENTDFGECHITVGTEASGGGMWNIFARNPFYHTGDISEEWEFNNEFFREVPFIPVAFRCHAISYSHHTSQTAKSIFPAFFW